MQAHATSNLFTTPHTQSTLTGLPQGSFIQNNESNFLQIFAPLQTFDHMGGSMLPGETHLFEYPNQTGK
jgi:hypothetical protein